ncbi:MAG TPA: helix-turn-helix transcriptional regulator [Kofleriaceae bacterium]|nr:helix-turn-helix transcriptional regulator [Kofleriaceae bacterium]
MRRAADLASYLEDSREAYIVCRESCAFHTANLFGVIAWGRPGIDEARQIVEARVAELRDPEPHAVVLDYRLVEVIDPDAFKMLAEFVTHNRETLAKVTSRAALVPPSEPFAAATVAGFYKVVQSPYPSQLCDTLEDAEAWLGMPTVTPVLQLHELAAAGRPTTTALVQVLEKQPALGVDDAARALGLTGRTLQRRLQSEGTTFVLESRKATVRRAKHLLQTTDDKIADIARAVGCASAQHFTELFRLEAGVPPATWRANTRKRA